MATEFREARMAVPGGAGTKTLERRVTFDGNVRKAGAAIKSFRFDYVNSDHNINVIEVRVGLRDIDEDAVVIVVTCQYADQNFDDAYTGRIEVMVFADVA